MIDLPTKMSTIARSMRKPDLAALMRQLKPECSVEIFETYRITYIEMQTFLSTCNLFTTQLQLNDDESIECAEDLQSDYFAEAVENALETSKVNLKVAEYLCLEYAAIFDEWMFFLRKAEEQLEFGRKYKATAQDQEEARLMSENVTVATQSLQFALIELDRRRAEYLAISSACDQRILKE